MKIAFERRIAFFLIHPVYIITTVKHAIWLVNNHAESDSPVARDFLRFPKLLPHPTCMDDAILRGKPFGNIPLF
jgi:hypothetical protein